jgi:predicted  nucleic acid-binding Zn-ribbon protein
MAFFHQLIANLEHTPAWQQDVQARGGAVSEVLKFAPKRMRPQHRTTEDRINQLKTEIKQWQDRALLAETRLHFIEKSIQQIAAKHVKSQRNTSAPCQGK